MYPKSRLFLWSGLSFTTMHDGNGELVRTNMILYVCAFTPCIECFAGWSSTRNYCFNFIHILSRYIHTHIYKNVYDIHLYTFAHMKCFSIYMVNYSQGFVHECVCMRCDLFLFPGCPLSYCSLYG